jgi:hypothetical protein
MDLAGIVSILLLMADIYAIIMILISIRRCSEKDSLGSARDYSASNRFNRLVFCWSGKKPL